MRYFSQSSSSLPLQDFYNILPKPKENPVDYWIRLNKATDTADEGLRSQGRRMENISGEVAQIEWTAKDIQLRIDEYQRESGASAMSYSVPQLKNFQLMLRLCLCPAARPVPTACPAATECSAA
ncbi:hypothetical protein N1851_015106 [Merluccius polli]|uniref:Uncharacterized protein n=1 Tax=Merluccius polli TaxID=89951 RepID=A0AA47P405_MERPO|nr:hypothetical protein N1851_015106 [Merluccius polli]